MSTRERRHERTSPTPRIEPHQNRRSVLMPTAPLNYQIHDGSGPSSDERVPSFFVESMNRSMTARSPYLPRTPREPLAHYGEHAPRYCVEQNEEPCGLSPPARAP
jgi:hypothetical protein